jgi:ankyrin repeat protein
MMTAAAYGSPLAEASYSHAPAVVRLLLARGVDVNRAAPDRHTPLIFAALAGDATITELLLKAGADINARGSRGMTPLMAAVCGGDAGLVGRLIEGGADLDARNDAGQDAVAVGVELDERAALEVVRAAKDRRRRVPDAGAARAEGVRHSTPWRGC